MVPDEAVWKLVKMLIEGQQMLVLMRRAAEAAQQAATVTPQQTEEVVAAWRRQEDEWYGRTLPGIIASLKLAVEVFDTFGPGPTRITDPTDAAIWNNKRQVWTYEFGGR